MEIPIVRNILEANEAEAERLRETFARAGILVLNLISGPGSGKTTLLEKTLAALPKDLRTAVIEGDQQTDHDARRIAATGARCVQINTGAGCHLNSSMVAAACEYLDLSVVDALFIENVGNMVCPVAFNLGEDAKIALLSVAEGDDKPAKYPSLFQCARAMLLTKIDLLPHVDFDQAKAVALARALNADLPVFSVSCRNDYGLEPWIDWIVEEWKAKRAALASRGEKHV